MNAFVEECRREWKRLGVPDGLAEEMAAELESDLAEAEADGVSAAEMLGESDPRRFAANWARERGLVSEPTPTEETTARLAVDRRRGLFLVLSRQLARAPDRWFSGTRPAGRCESRPSRRSPSRTSSE